MHLVSLLHRSLICGGLLSFVWGLPAYAGDTANITVTATIVTRTCTPQWSGDQKIALGSVDGSGASGKGAVIAQGDLTLSLKDCNNVSKIAVTATGTADGNDTSAFANQASTDKAKGVAVYLMGGPNQDTRLDPKGTTSVDYPVSSNAADMKFTAFLEANGGYDVSDGQVNVPITLNMTYE